MRKIAHIVNPVGVDKSSDLFVAQPITFATMNSARDFAQGRVDVSLLSAQYQEDRSIVPSGFQTTRDLERSVLDVGTFQRKRKLPLIQDILDRLYETTDAEFLVYTNVDIALMPHFYIAVDHFLEQGYDAFFINRRTISKDYQRVEQIPLMYSETGELHPGYDCFVFRRDVYPRYRVGATCIGACWVGGVLNTNLICHATKFGEFRNMHLTFHIGYDCAWKEPDLMDYEFYNKNEFYKILKYYESEQKLAGRPMVEEYLRSIEQLYPFQVAKEKPEGVPLLRRIKRGIKRRVDVW